MNISTKDQIELCTVVADKIAELAQQQGKHCDPEVVFSMLFDGDYCDLFDNLLSEF